MQTAIVMLIALSGLGCHHKPCAGASVPSYCEPRALYAIDYATLVEPSCYNPCYGCGDGCLRWGYTRDGWGPESGGYVGCFAGGAIGCGCTRFPRH